MKNSEGFVCCIVALNVLGPSMSHYTQPWRGYVETRSGYDFLNGIGVILHTRIRDEDTVEVTLPVTDQPTLITIGRESLRHAVLGALG